MPIQSIKATGLVHIDELALGNFNRKAAPLFVGRRPTRQAQPGLKIYPDKDLYKYLDESSIIKWLNNPENYLDNFSETSLERKEIAMINLYPLNFYTS